MTGNINVTWHHGRWWVTQEPPESFVIGSYLLKRDAMIAADAVGRYAGVEVKPHNLLGRFIKSGRSSHGHDPHPPKG